MEKKIITTILFLVCLLVNTTFVSCSKDDNPSENINPYKICWKTDAKAKKDNYFLVQADGGTFTFNFYRGTPWLWSIKETVYGKSILTNTEFGNRDNLETSWTIANFVKIDKAKNKLTVTIKPSDATEMRYIYVTVTNSVRSQTIAFKQFGIYTGNK